MSAWASLASARVCRQSPQRPARRRPPARCPGVLSSRHERRPERPAGAPPTPDRTDRWRHVARAAGLLGRRRHRPPDDLRRDVRPRRADRCAQPRAGLPGRRRTRVGGARRGRGDRRRAPTSTRPAPASPRCARRSQRTSSAATACGSTRTTRCSSPPGATEALAAARARAGRPRRRGAHARAVLRRVRGRHRAGRGDAHDRAAARDARRVPPRRRGARGRVHRPHPADPAQHAAQPDRRGARPARSWPSSPTLATRHDAIVVTDEVYEHLVLDADRAHVPIATLPGMARAHADRLVGRQDVLVHRAGRSAGSAARPRSSTRCATVKQFLTYVTGAPFQPAIAFALQDEDVAAWVDSLGGFARAPA